MFAKERAILQSVQQSFDESALLATQAGAFVRFQCLDIPQAVTHAVDATRTFRAPMTAKVYPQDRFSIG
jgi:hypothetical protein